MTTTCDCCEERPSVCDQCQRWEVDDDDIDASGWSITNQSAAVCCERCRKSNERDEWQEQTEAACEALCEEHGWVMELISRASTGSAYYELTRDVDDDDDDDDAEAETIKLRISDHGSCYCSEDVSIAMNPSGDDHDLDFLARRLAK